MLLQQNHLKKWNSWILGYPQIYPVSLYPGIQKNVGSDLNNLFTEGNKVPTGLDKRISTETFRLKSLPFDITASLTFRA